MTRDRRTCCGGGHEATATVIGGGVAGAATAYFLAQAGVRVTVVDAGVHAASHVPSALVNPVRGQSGAVDPQAADGLTLTWELLRALTAQGHAVPHGQTGVLRPVPDEAARARFTRNLPATLPHHWLPAAEVPAGEGDALAGLAPGWPHALWLPGGGWLDGRALCAALLAASGAQVLHGRAGAWTGTQVTVTVGGPPVSRTPEQLTLRAGAVVFCGGSVGVSWAGESATHRMGTLLTLDRAPGAVPVSFGAYLAPAEAGGVLGATFEAPAPAWRPPALPAGSLRWLLGKGEALRDLRGVSVTGRWTGSRLSGLRCGQDASGAWRLTGLGSKGFLLGPLLARTLAAQISAALLR